jgi:hypothetical protein
MNHVTAALNVAPDDCDEPPHRRLVRIAEQVAGMVEAGEFDRATPATGFAMAALSQTLMDIAGKIAPERPTKRASDIITAVTAARTDADLGDAWLMAAARRLNLPVAEQVLVIMAYLDRQTRLAQDDGR